MARRMIWTAVLFTSLVVCVTVVVLDSKGWVPVLWEGTMLIDGAPQYPAPPLAVSDPAVAPASAVNVAGSAEPQTTDDAAPAPVATLAPNEP